MEYPTLKLTEVAEAEKFHCPFGCKADECDAKGYCGHLVGFTTDREIIEPLTELLRYNSDKGSWFSTGHLATRLADRELVQLPGDVFVNPVVRETIRRTGQEYDKYCWISFRVYSNDPDRKPIPYVEKKRAGPKVKNPSFEFKHRQKQLEEALSAPGPDADIHVNPRKQQRVTKNKEAAAASARKGKKRISTAMTAAGAPDQPTTAEV
jgi:hypothetical protein